LRVFPLRGRKRHKASGFCKHQQFSHAFSARVYDLVRSLSAAQELAIRMIKRAERSRQNGFRLLWMSHDDFVVL
jgi:hypothetical protein